MELISGILVLAVSLYFLSKSADWFTESAEKIGLWLRISPFLVGVTIVAIGTSLPELFSSIFAVIEGSSEIVAGNVIGSNITNILLILGVSALVAKKIKIEESFLRIDLMVFITSVFILFLVSLNGVITFVETLVLLTCFVTYIFYIIKTKKTVEPKEVKPLDVKRESLKPSVYIKLIISVIVLFISAKYTIDGIIAISESFAIGTEIIAATVVAFGTSLPELVVSVNAARKGKAEIAVGNVLGSNIFNIFAVVGISGLFGILIVPQNIVLIGSLFMIISTFLYYFAVKDKRFSSWDGLFLLILYLLYLIQIFGRA